MGKRLLLLLLTMTWLIACGQQTKEQPKKATNTSEQVATSTHNKSQLYAAPELAKFIYTDTTYVSASGKEVIIQNSYPKGGMIAPNGKQYIDSTGERNGFAVFWTRIINTSDVPIELNINFPVETHAIFKSPGSYLKLFLPPDVLTYDKLTSFNYGLTELQSYLDANYNKTSTLQKTIQPNEEHIFYIATLSYIASGTPRSGLILKEESLYYRMSLEPDGGGIVSCGKLTFKN